LATANALLVSYELRCFSYEFEHRKRIQGVLVAALLHRGFGDVDEVEVKVQWPKVKKSYKFRSSNHGSYCESCRNQLNDERLLSSFRDGVRKLLQNTHASIFPSFHNVDGNSGSSKLVGSPYQWW
jgi:hypothetical protein